jgi:hypothetical protein
MKQVTSATTMDDSVKIWVDTLSTDEEHVSQLLRVKEGLKELFQVVPHDRHDSIYNIEKAIDDILTRSNDMSYRQGYQNCVDLMFENMRERQAAAILDSQKPRYMIMELESRRKDAVRLFPYSKTGWIYRLSRIIKDYTNSVEADNDLAGLLSGEISETDLFRRKIKV